MYALHKPYIGVSRRRARGPRVGCGGSVWYWPRLREGRPGLWPPRGQLAVPRPEFIGNGVGVVPGIAVMRR